MNQAFAEKNSKPLPLKILLLLAWPFMLVGRIILKTLVVWVVISLVCYGGLYLYLESNPEARQAWDDGKKNVSILMHQQGWGRFANLAGLPEPTEEELNDIGQNPLLNSGLVEKVMSAMGQSGALPAGLALPNAAGGNLPDDAIPYAMQPMLDAFAGSSRYQQYKQQMTVAAVGQDGSGAVPMLERSLRSENEVLRKAATESLQRIATDEALQVLEEFYAVK